jgi:hypothetical protein
MRSRLNVLVVALAVLVAACGGDAGPAPTTPDEALGSATAETGETPDPAEQPDEGGDGGVDLSAGACLVEELIEYQGEEKPALTGNVACSEPHAAEVVAVVNGDSFLDARTACKELAAAEYPDIAQERFYPMGPTARGGSEYACLYDSAGETGSLRGS